MGGWMDSFWGQHLHKYSYLYLFCCFYHSGHNSQPVPVIQMMRHSYLSWSKLTNMSNLSSALFISLVAPSCCWSKSLGSMLHHRYSNNLDIPKNWLHCRHTNPIWFEKQIVCSVNRLQTAWACAFICHRCTTIRHQRNRVQSFSCPPLPDFNYCETDFIHLHRRANYAQVCFWICLVKRSAHEQFPLTLPYIYSVCVSVCD